MANIYDQILRGSFNQIGVPSGMTNDETLSWIGAYGKPVQQPTAPTPMTMGGRSGAPPTGSLPSPVMAYGAQSQPNPAVAAATGMGASPVTSVSGTMKPTGGPGWQFGDGLLGLLGSMGGGWKDLGTMLSGTGQAQPQGGLAGLLGGAAARPQIAANALIDGRSGRDNMAGANFQGRSVGTDGIVRAFNNDSKRFENVSQNRRLSPSEGRRTDSLGDRDMRQTRKAGPGR